MTTFKLTDVDGKELTASGHLVLDEDFVSVVDLDEDEVILAVPAHRVASVKRTKETPDLVDLGATLLGNLLNRKS